MRVRLGSLVAVVLSLPAVPAAAAGADPATAQACVLNAGTGDLRCYDGLDELLAAETGGQVQAPPSGVLSAHDVAVFNQAANATVAARAVVNAVFYDQTARNGAQLLMETSSDCDDQLDVDWQWASLTPSWQNRIRSGQAYGRCQFKVWDDPGFSGDAWGYYTYSGDFGSMNGRAESVRMR